MTARTELELQRVQRRVVPKRRRTSSNLPTRTIPASRPTARWTTTTRSIVATATNPEHPAGWTPRPDRRQTRAGSGTASNSIPQCTGRSNKRPSPGLPRRWGVGCFDEILGTVLTRTHAHTLTHTSARARSRIPAAIMPTTAAPERFPSSSDSTGEMVIALIDEGMKQTQQCRQKDFA